MYVDFKWLLGEIMIVLNVGSLLHYIFTSIILAFKKYILPNKGTDNIIQIYKSNFLRDLAWQYQISLSWGASRDSMIVVEMIINTEQVQRTMNSFIELGIFLYVYIPLFVLDSAISRINLYVQPQLNYKF